MMKIKNSLQGLIQDFPLFLNKINTLQIVRKTVFYFCLGQCILGSFFLIQCSKDKQVLASYQKDNIEHPTTRQELRWLIEIRSQKPLNATKPTIDFQQKTLKSYLLMQTELYDINQSEIKKTPYYKENSFLLEEKAKLTAYEMYSRASEEELQFTYIETQLVFLNDRSPPPPPKEKPAPAKGAKSASAKKSSASAKSDGESASLTPREKEAEELQAQLNSPKITNAEIEEKIYEISEHPRYRLQGGYIDPICISCANNPFDEFMEQIEKAGPGKFIKINQNGMIWLLRLIKKYTIEEDEIQEKLEAFYRKTVRIAKRNAKKLPPGAASSRGSPLSRILLSQEEIEANAKQRAKWIAQREMQNIVFSKVSRLKKRKNFTLHEAGKIKKNSLKDSPKTVYKADTVLYTLDGKGYTYALLEKIWRETRKQKFWMKSSRKISRKI